MRRNQKGAAATLLAILVPVIVAVLGLVFDVGNLHARKRRAQTAADATAIAAAHELRKQNTESYEQEAIRDAAKNGFEAGDDTNISINRPPISGPVSGDDNFVEVVITQEAPLLFMRMFGRDAATVQIRSVAGLVDRDVCTYVLDPSAPRALSVTSSARLSQLPCAIQVNSSHSNAARTRGVGEVGASMVSVVGNYSGNGFYPTPEISAGAVDNPLEDLPPPSYGGCDHADTIVVDGEQTLNPGVYCGGIEVQANGRARLNPGEYIINGGGLSIGSSCTPCSGGSDDGCGGGSDDGCGGGSGNGSGNGGGSGNGRGGGSAPSCTPARIEGDGVMFYITGSSCGASGGGPDSDASAMLRSWLRHDAVPGEHLASVEDAVRATLLAVFSPRPAYASASGAGGDGCAASGYRPIQFKKESEALLTPPTNGTYAGVLFFDDPAVTGGADHKFEDDARLELTGAAYFKNRGLRVRDDATVTWHTMTLAVNDLELSGNGRVTVADRTPTVMAPAALDASLRE